MSSQQGAHARTPAEDAARADSIARLVQTWRPKILAAAYRILRDRDEAQDVAQDVFLAALMSLDTDRPGGMAYRWLVVTAQRRAYDVRRRKHGRRGQRKEEQLDDSHAVRSEVAAGSLEFALSIGSGGVRTVFGGGGAEPDPALAVEYGMDTALRSGRIVALSATPAIRRAA